MPNAKPLILFDNISTDAQLTAPGNDVGNLLDYRTYTFWTGPPVGKKAKKPREQILEIDCSISRTADTLAIIGHNLASSGAQMSLRSKQQKKWVEHLMPFTPVTDKAFLKTFPSAQSAQWNLRITPGEEPPRIAVLMLGSRLTFERYPQPFDPFPEELHAESAVSVKGHLLASALQNITSKINVEWKYLSDAWVSNEFQQAWDHHLSLLKPFFWAWDIEGHPDEVYYVRMPHDFHLSKPFDPLRRSLSLTFETLKEMI
jgi:hypothetical protein